MEKSHAELGKEYFDRGLELANSKEYEKAIAEYEKAIAEYKQVEGYETNIELQKLVATSYYQMGHTNLALNHDKEAEVHFTLAINECKNSDTTNKEVQTTLMRAYAFRALAYSMQGKYIDAIANYTEALEEPILEYRTLFYNKRGNLYFENKQYDNALKDYDAALAIDPKFEPAYIDRGTVKSTKGAYLEAIEDYNHALDLNPDNPLTYTNRGNIYSRLKDYDKAILDYDKAINLDSNYINAYLNKARTHFSKGEIDNAIQTVNKVIDIDRNCSEAYALRGSLCFGKDDQALTDYCDAIKIIEKSGDPSNISPEVYIAAAQIYIRKDASEKASKVLGGCNLLHILHYDIFPSLDDIEDANVKARKEAIRKEVLYPFVEQDYLFNKMTKTKKELNTDSYKEIYLLSLELMTLLHVKDLTNESNGKPSEPTVAHYTRKKTAEKLLFKEIAKEGSKTVIKVSPMRLSSVATANDPEEGLTLLRCLGIGKLSNFENSNYEQSYFGAFITCLTFNHESLNQFRLYGKENNKEATGVSLVIRKDYFEANLNKGIVSTSPNLVNINALGSSLGVNIVNRTPLDKSNESNKLPLFRCVYMDPHTNEIVSVGHREHYTFYRESEPREGKDKDVKAYAEKIKSIVDQFAEKFKKLQEEIDTLNTELREKQDKENLSREDRKKEQAKQDAIIAELLLNLRYLVKHVAFKEEQECRIIKVANFEDENIIVEANARMFIDYLPITLSDLHRVYFAPSTGGHKLFQDQMKKEGFPYRCQISDSPFRKEAE